MYSSDSCEVQVQRGRSGSDARDTANPLIKNVFFLDDFERLDKPE